MAHDVFISYSIKDKVVADAVCGTLEAAGIQCWIAPRDIHPSSNWASAIMDGIAQSRVMVLVWSANASDSPAVTREVHLAFKKGVAVIPFRVEDVAFRKELEFFLEAVHWLDAITPPLQVHLDHLAQVTTRLLNREDADSLNKVTPSPAIGKGKTENEGDRNSSAQVGDVTQGHQPSPSRLISTWRRLMMAGLATVSLLVIVTAVYTTGSLDKLLYKSVTFPTPDPTPSKIDHQPTKSNPWAHTEETSPDGKTYAGAAAEKVNGQNTYFVYLTPVVPNEGVASTCCDHSLEIQHLTWSPDSKNVISGDKDTLNVWDRETKKKKQSWRVDNDEVLHLTFRDKDNLLCHYSNRIVERFNLITGQRKKVPTGIPERQDLVEIRAKK